MSLKTYNKLSQDQKPTTNFPSLTAAKLTSKLHKGKTAKQVIDEVNTFAPQQGWVSYRDKVEITATAPTNEYFIEAQYSNGNNSLHIKLITNNLYQMIELNANEPEQHNIETAIQTYSEQELVLRSHLSKQALTASYRLWWQLDNDETSHHYGRWLPLVQQFFGFNHNAQGE